MPPSLTNNDDTQTMDNYMNLRELSKYPLPLGLKLTLTPEMLPYKEQKTNDATKIQSTSCQQEIKKVEKLKAVHVPMYMLMIGYFKVEAKYPADLVSKFYYAKRKLVWEILRDGLKDKIEIQWRNITAIRAIIKDNLPGILEIELDKVPCFFREIEPKPGKHTVWTLSHDFTQGQASKYRRHYIQFPHGVLDQYYAKLLQCDNRLLELSQRPFPSSHAIYFDSHLDRRTTQLNFCHDSENPSVADQQVHDTLPLIANYNNSTSDETINNEMLQNPMMPSSWSQGSYDYTSLLMESVPSASCIQAQPSGHAWLNNYELPSHLNNMMIGGYHDQEIEFNTTQSIEASLVYNYNTNTSTQFDWSMLS
ncbi:ATP-dependent DNA helicase [Trifolium repens]|nr:ATP-dependent DNA helicase [Trifolium repens]